MRASNIGSLAVMVLACSWSGCSSDDMNGSEVNPGGTSSTGGGSTAGGSSGGNAGSLSIPLGGAPFGEGEGGDSGMPDLPSEVNVLITADNAYGFGYGTKNELANYFGGVENPDSGDIFDCPVGEGPEAYVVPAEDANIGGFLYIVGYADKSTTQGVIAKFFREGAKPVYTGTGSWQACATGEDYDPGSGGPDLATINEYIVKCNSGELDPETSSGGWVSTKSTAGGRLVFGEDNSTTRDDPQPGNEFLVVCDIEPSAKWMWFDWVPERESGSPFMWPGGSDNTTKDFVIFRLGADQVPQKPPT
jgi:hypothetical protein